MTEKRILTGLLVLSVVLAGRVLLGVAETAEKAEKPSQVVVGTFDSRAVTLAFGESPFWSTYERMNPESVAPPADATPQGVEQWKINRRKISFRQGFGRGDVSEYLDFIKDQIPRIAQETGVDVIVSKWDIVYHRPNVKFVDVTEALIQPFEPTEERLEIIRDVMKVPAATEKEIRQREKSQGIN